jgi:transposase-like protein
MVHEPVVCPYCQGDQVGKRGKTDTGKQRYRCHNPECDHQSFLLNPAYKGRLPEIKQQVIEMSLNGSGIRDTARVLQISTATVIHELKKKRLPSRRSILPSGTHYAQVR